MTLTPTKEWWTAAEIAAQALPDLANSRQGVEAQAKRDDWRAHPEHARKRAGRGGGWEYHWRLFPSRAQRELIGRATAPTSEGGSTGREDVWAWFDGLPEKTKDKARCNLRIVQEVETSCRAMTKNLAVGMVASQHGCSERTIWNLYRRIEGVDPADWLAYLAPKHRASSKKGVTARASAEFFDLLKGDYLRLGPHSFTSSYERAVKICKAKGLAYLTPRTARRWFDQNVPRVTQVFAREGEAGLAKCFPPQIRDRSTLTALEGVNADCHKIDVFVQWPGIEKPVRPQIVGFQDLYSNKILSWRVDLDPNKVAVMSAFGELVETWGIPHHCLFDNGREFANKWLTGGVPTRFRFKIRDDDALGVLPQMGIQIHWAQPAHGQAKPIERGFRDFADRIALDPRFAGAYVGKRPDAKPEDYGSRAIPLEDFLRVLDEGIRDHNARQGRLTDTAKGRSFDDTFAESYASAPIRKATPEQHRLWLMGQEVRKLHRTHGELTLHRNKYWADWMNEHAGEKVVARFDPENLHAGVYIYSLAGAFMGMSECSQKVGFFDLVGAKLHAKVKRQRRKAEKALLDAMRPVSVQDIAAELDRLPQPETPLVEAKVVEMAPARHRKPLVQRSLPVPDTAADERLKVFTAEFGKPKPAPEAKTETAEDRFRRALDIERRSEAGEPISEEDAEFLSRMQKLPKYRAQRLSYDSWGDQAIN
ncbi:transposase domain-containing protein [Salipiger abyssi]|uniref:Mu DNA-binding domain-containing protein n=1 Tax=Salipiger abyssi TaxID=1250539 RepID=A0A1P8UXN2_9RHOB|nr:transposase domain-containing protein [Salipiger abyssi]ALF02134.1 mobile element protein [Pelagibaca phage vB_PeaS-P1]APZ54149.1 Mu DNA-binding domain-containing protein [Salipiger abyssi]